MENLTPQNITVMFLSLGILLGAARVLGELAQRLRQPAVLGELLAGVLLGQTVLGALAPEFFAHFFPSQGPNAIALNAITTLAVVFFLLVAGMEVNLSTIWTQGKLALKIGVGSMVLPFVLGFAAAWLVPHALGRPLDADRVVFAMFFATALSITALPIIAKTLMDMDLYRSDMGMVVVSAAILNDLVGWIVFAVILGMMGGPSGHENNIAFTITMTLAFAGAMLTLGRWLLHRTLPLLQAYARSPNDVLGFALILAMLAAAFTEWIGIHAIFGSFLVGVAIGDSSHLRERTRVTIHQFISTVFAPLFFASIGLRVNFITHFDLPMVLTVLLIACAAKLIGGTLGALWGGMPGREAWAVGFAMNSRGAMEIILGLLALEAGIIRQRLFVALVFMALVTSVICGPFMRVILRPERKRRLHESLTSKLFLRKLQAATAREAIHELTMAACESAGLEAGPVEAAVWARERSLGTGIGHGVALPHARISHLNSTLVVVGVSDGGIDFDAPDGQLAHVIFLALTPSHDFAAQLAVASGVARLFRDGRMFERVLQTKSFTDFLALIRSVDVESESA